MPQRRLTMATMLTYFLLTCLLAYLTYVLTYLPTHSLTHSLTYLPAYVRRLTKGPTGKSGWPGPTLREWPDLCQSCCAVGGRWWSRWCQCWCCIMVVWWGGVVRGTIQSRTYACSFTTGSELLGFLDEKTKSKRRGHKARLLGVS